MIGCGAVGLALRRQPRHARRRRGLGVRPVAGARRRDQRARAPALRRRRGRRPRPGRRPTRRSSRQRLRDRRDEEHAHRRRRWPRPRTPSSDGAVCSVQNGAGNEELIAEHVTRGDPRHDLPGRARRRAGARRLGHEGRHAHRPVRAEPGADGEGAARSPTPARARGMPTHALEDARGAQWRKLIFNAASNAIARADRPHARPDRRARRRASSRGR